VNGVHDVGGVHGYGAVRPEPDEPAFHAPWEGRVLALHLALGRLGTWTLDEYRFNRELLPPAQQLTMSYYETVLAALERLTTAHGFLGQDELTTGRSLRPGPSPGPALSAAAVLQGLGWGSPPRREPLRPAAFKVGDEVRTRNRHPLGHTRLPGYVRGHSGMVVAVLGCHAFPDTRAGGGGDDPQWLYTVRFTARELWGPDGDPTLTLSVDAFEPYLEPTEGGTP
jgi:nitrile hydratase beta subunit